MGLFITLEGPEGTGKTTQAGMLADRLSAAGYPVVLTREPGGTAVGERIRAILSDPQHPEINPVTEALLFNAARAQLVAEVIRPALAKGRIVICDRFSDSTIAYQGYGHGLSLGMLRALVDIATGRLSPDLTILLDLEPGDGLKRKLAALSTEGGPEWNRIDAKAIEFHERIRAGFLKMAREEPGRWMILNAAQPAEVLNDKITERSLRILSERNS